MTAEFVVTISEMIVFGKWEDICGVLTVGGMMAFHELNLVTSGRFPRGSVFSLCFLPVGFVSESKR